MFYNVQCLIFDKNMSIHSFCSEKINEAVSLLGKGVGVTVVSNGLGVLRKRKNTQL